MRIAGHTAVFLDDAGKVLNYGALSLGDTVYAALYCEEVNNVTLVTDKGAASEVITVLWADSADYERCLSELKEKLPLHFSPQNKRINRYAEAVAEKLALGIKLRITDAVHTEDMIQCPECGTLNPAGGMYCLECGAELE